MINPIVDPIDEAIDRFEVDWSPGAPDAIRGVLRTFGLSHCTEAITELIRVDIERRYCSGLSCRLSDYAQEFPELNQDPDRFAEIAFEDYRVCTQLGHPLHPDRYRHLPGVADQEWFREFQQSVSHVPNLRHRDSKPATDPYLTNESSLDWIDLDTRAVLNRIGFHPIQKLGEGTFSDVFLATQSDLASRFVVLKVVRQARGEPQKMAMLQHTNIVPIYSFHVVSPLAIICMPYAGGITLGDYLHDSRNIETRDGMSLVKTICNESDETVIDSSLDLPTKEILSRHSVNVAGDTIATPLSKLRGLDKERLALWIFSRLASALVHSHTRGVLHGDLKPANVLIRNDGEPALMDFNLSRSLHLPNDVKVGGTLAYMAPENLRSLLDQQCVNDARSDIYSLGVILFEFLTGRLPYPRPLSTADTDVEIAWKARQTAIVWSDTDRVSSSLRSIVERSLAFSPEHRYASAEKLEEDLQRETMHQPLAHAQDTIRTRGRKWIRRHPRAISTLAMTALLAASVIPLALVATRFYQQSSLLVSAAEFATFENESAESLTTMMADPQRFQPEGVQRVLEPLRQHRLLEPKALGSILSGALDDDGSLHRRTILFRHYVCAAIAHCKSIAATPVPPQSDFVLLDQIIAAAEICGEATPSPALAYLRATRAELDGDTTSASNLLKKAESLSIDSDQELFLESVRLIAKRRWSQARDLLESLADRGSVPTALRWTSLGYSQYHLGEFENAKLSFTQSIERSPESASLWLLRGMCCLRLRLLGLAESDYRQALAINPELVAGHYHLAEVLLRSDRVDESIGQLNHALAKSPDKISLLLLRSRALARAGRVKESLDDRERMIAAKDLPVSQLLIRADAQSEVDPQAAIEDLNRAIQQRGRTVEILQVLARAQVKAGQTSEAIDTLAELYELESDNEKSVIDRAVLLAREKRFDEARDALASAIEPPNSPSVLYQAACVCALLPDSRLHVQALRHLSAAVQRGYGARSLARDKDLDAIRHMPGFQAIERTTQLARLDPANEVGLDSATAEFLSP